jgi:hypothetical protein
MEISLLKKFKEKLKQLSLMNLIFLLALMISIFLLIEHLPAIVRFFYHTFFK